MMNRRAMILLLVGGAITPPTRFLRKEKKPLPEFNPGDYQGSPLVFINGEGGILKFKHTVKYEVGDERCRGVVYDLIEHKHPVKYEIGKDGMLVLCRNLDKAIDEGVKKPV